MTELAQDARLERVVFDRAGVPGPTLIVVGGLHANEPAGLVAAERIGVMLEKTGGPQRGRVVAIRGNLAALESSAEAPWLRPRYIDTDLNRVFSTIAHGEGDAPRELDERDAIRDLLAHLVSESHGACYLIDMHTVSSDSPAFVAFEDSLAARRFVMSFPLPKIVGLEEELNGLLMDYATREHGYISCIIEAGRHDDPRSADVHEAVVLMACIHLDLIEEGILMSTGERPVDVVRAAAGKRGASIYDVHDRAIVGDTSFRMRDDASAFMRVKAHKTVIADESGRVLTPETSGLLFMPNRQPRVREGDDAYFVVARVGRLWLALSAFLRERQSIHWVLRRFVPGVRVRDGHPADLLVSPEITPLLRREIFHLLGYRMIRHGTAHYRPLGVRVVRTVRATVVAMVRIFFGLFRPDPWRSQDERETDWIVRRRVLDQHPPGRRSDGHC